MEIKLQAWYNLFFYFIASVLIHLKLYHIPPFYLRRRLVLTAISIFEVLFSHYVAQGRPYCIKTNSLQYRFFTLTFDDCVFVGKGDTPDDDGGVETSASDLLWVRRPGDTVYPCIVETPLLFVSQLCTKYISFIPLNTITII